MDEWSVGYYDAITCYNNKDAALFTQELILRSYFEQHLRQKIADIMLDGKSPKNLTGIEAQALAGLQNLLEVESTSITGKTLPYWMGYCVGLNDAEGIPEDKADKFAMTVYGSVKNKLFVNIDSLVEYNLDKISGSNIDAKDRIDFFKSNNSVLQKIKSKINESGFAWFNPKGF